ncbi:NADH-dependent formate dehydrogenase delta subunit FdsD [Marinomonas aquimarina]|uniref:NADH-dependent formate dehydrogenase delta subunit FdsD n=1 Tax=Marinomonas aquimarina TaxID=295068 RepID=A0A1A8TM97_9GAMM|nr:formate dehydrogenase subunit delta [Marinomonas aquimarina]SBS34825.1 NADH-dependent formate dehydrogenase delta subunit FdsD [Marinomonas aquimarina]
MFHTEEESIVTMINQIAQNNVSAGSESEVADMVENHIVKFWSRRMKKILAEQLASGTAEFEPAALVVAQRLSAKASA